ncbi:efflux RND transporter periplasmic adaptor subunit [Variovorax sp. H27-G14]|uniref:efflux RND transporter periplasmic adaptor subunit n=1 Tax=Variovorax sp. H27-G14 TaxID=3111914 RepID=UPI0038FBEBB6
MPDHTPSRFALLFTALAIAALAGCSRTSVETPGTAKAATAPEKEVGAVTLKHETLALSTELPGRTAAPVIAEIRPQVGGILKERLFTEGAQVKAGQALYQLDPAPLQAAHASAQASVRKAESALATSRTVARRNAELVKIDAISRQVFDESQATEQQAEADVGVARAAEQTARIQLGYTRITSPITGWAELSAVTPGALVTANQAAVLTTVQQLDPIHVHVTQSSSELLRLKRELASGRLQRASDAEARIQLVLEDGSKYPHAGRLTFSGVTVDAGTGSVTLRAVVPNPDRLLMPGMYVRAVLQEGTNANALLVPQQAVTRAPDGSASALVIDAENKVAKRPIRVGRAVGTRWEVLEGMAPGDRVMTEGSQRVKVGDKVKVVDLGDKPAGSAQGAAQGAAPGPVASAARDAAGTASDPVAR